MTIIDDIKARANIIEVIGADVKLKETGSSYTGFCPFHTNKQTPALVVYPNNGDDGYFKCFACGEHGDVIHYVEKRNPGWDTKEAMHFLAEKYGIEMREEKTPVTGRISAATAAEIRNVAMGVFKRWLVGETDRKTKEVLRKGDATALEYALDRGWTVETLRFEGIGFSGNGTEAERKEMTDEFRMYGIDPLCPDAVMVLGMRVDPSTSSGQSVAKWAEKYELDESAFRGDQTRIMGFMDVPALMYAHRFGGRVEYMSARYLPEFEKKWGRKSHNPNSALAGSKRCYRNSLYREHHLEGQEKGALLYIVEGQGDAVTGRQFGVPMVALCGAQWIYLMESGEVAEWKRDYEEFIYVTDADKAGQEVVTGQEFKFDLSTALGAMLWVGRTENKSWKRPSGNEKSIKDINDIAQYLRDTKAEEKESNRIFNSIRMGAERIVAVAARYAGTLDGQAKTTTLDKVLKPMILSVPDEQRVLLERDLAMALYPNLPKANALSDFRKWLRAQVKAAQASGDEDEKLEEVETFGGWYPSRENKDSGHLVEVYYDRETEKLRLAWAHITSLKNNVREIGWGKTLTLEDKILLPPEYDATIQDGIQFHSSALKVPAKVGEKVSTAEIIKRFSNFYQKYFYSEDKSKFKFCAVWSANSHLYDCFDIINILRAMGPPGSGKSDLMYLVGLTSYRFAVTAATSSPMSHVGLAKLYHATDMIDEYDSAMKRDDGTLASYLKARPMRRIAHSFKMMEVMSGSTRTFIPGNTPIYGPTMVTGYKKFEDKGLESRCLTFDLTKTDMILLDVSIHAPNEGSDGLI